MIIPIKTFTQKKMSEKITVKVKAMNGQQLELKVDPNVCNSACLCESTKHLFIFVQNNNRWRLKILKN